MSQYSRSNLFAFLLAWPSFALAQGDLNAPAGVPAPTQRSLQEIWNRVDSAHTRAGQALSEHVASKSLLMPLAQDAASSFWKVSIVDHVGLVGNYPSLEFLPSGRPAIAYYDSTNRSLKYAVLLDSGWQLTTIDETANVGKFASLEISPEGEASIAYFDETNANLKFAQLSRTGWQITTVDSVGNVGQHASLRFGSDGEPLIAYYNATQTDLKIARRQSGGTWSFMSLSSADQLGLRNELHIHPDGSFRVLHYNQSNDQYELAAMNFSNDGLMSNALNEPTPVASIAYTGNPEARRAFLFVETQSPENNFLRWKLTGNFNTLIFEQTIDNGEGVDGMNGIIGTQLSAAFAPNGQAAVAYQVTYPTSPLLVQLKFARHNGSSWRNEMVDSSFQTLEKLSLALGPNGKVAIAYHEESQDDLRFALLDPLAPR